jgi:hypothetical protein
MAANVKIQTLSDITRQNWNLAIHCECGHRSIVDASRMARWYFCHRWDTHVARLHLHLYCLACRKCPATVRFRPSAQQPTAPNRFPNTEEQWARLVKGLRD